MFYGLLDKIRTVGGVGAWHGRRNHPGNEDGVSVPVWSSLTNTAEHEEVNHGATVTPIGIAGGNANG